MAEPDQFYRVLIVTRCRVGAHRLVPGEVLRFGADQLRHAAGLIRNKTAKAADARTARDVELFLRLQASPQ